jgi:hypothetical protein
LTIYASQFFQAVVSILKIKKTKIIDKDNKAMLLIEAIELNVELNDIYRD